MIKIKTEERTPQTLGINSNPDRPTFTPLDTAIIENNLNFARRFEDLNREGT